MQCPQLYKFRVVDQLPEPPSPAAVRGTLVHEVLERMFDLPAAQRTPDQTIGLLETAWSAVIAGDARAAELVSTDGRVDGATLSDWLAAAEPYIHAYFALEDPRRLEPESREEWVSIQTPTGLTLRGIIDRIDIAPDGAIRIVDYKTGKAPRPAYEGKALFQMRFYALVLWRLRGVVPRMLQLLYLGSGEIVRYEPHEEDLLAVERTIEALREAINTAHETGHWQAKTSRLCDWCAHKAICPAFAT